MKITSLLLLAILFSSMGLKARQFSDEYKISSHFPNQPTGPVDFDISKVTITKKQQAAIRDSLLSRLRVALYNLKDPNLGLAEFYDSLWGKGFTESLVSEIDHLIEYVNGGKSKADTSYRYVPSPADIDQLLHANVAEMKVLDQATGFYTPMREYQLIIQDPWKHWLWNYYKKSSDDDKVQGIQMDYEYRTGWQKLEKFYSSSVKYTEAIKEILPKVVDCNGETSVAGKIMEDVGKLIASEKKLGDNVIQKYIREKEFFRKWLWYNNGFISMNPLVYTSPDRVYPATDPNSMISDADKAALQAATADGELAKFLETKRIANRVLLPAPGKKSDVKLFNKKIKTSKNLERVIHFDASSGYTSSASKSVALLSEGQSMVYMIHNVPKGITYTQSHEEKELAVISPAAAQLDNALGLFSEGLTDLEGSAGQLAELLSLFRNVDFAPAGKISIANLKKGGAVEAAKAPIGDTATFFHSKANQLFWERAIQNNDDVDYIIVNRQKIVITKTVETDKRNIILATTMLDPTSRCPDCKPVPAYIVDSFLVRDQCYIFEYDDSQDITVRSAGLMLDRWKCFHSNVKKCQDQLKGLLNELQEMNKRYRPWISVTNRNLPPAFKEETVNEDALFSSVVIDPALPDPPKTKVYSITEVSATEGESSSGKVVIKQTIKHAGLTYIDVSAGIAFTTSSYSIGKKGSNGLPERQTGDQVQGMAALHVYPFGMFKLDGSIKPDLVSRSSLFIGVGIPKALDHFYTGYSYDIVPGFKAMTGIHLFRETRFRVVNNQITEQAQGLKYAGWFFAFNIQPATFISALSLF